MPLTIGARLGPYEIISPLGAGGMGEVYKARDTRLDRTVAIKVLPGHVASDPDLKQRFEREARTVAALNHPHICTLHDIGNHDGIDFLVMEHLEGETLADRLKKGALPLDQALRYAIEIADALDTAHRHGITHRDLKPGNIFLAASGAKLIDFGLARLRPSPAAGDDSTTMAESLTAAGTIMGTLWYMSPEQLQGRTADVRSDIWAFGCVLYEMVTGRRAFEGKTQAGVIAGIIEREPTPMPTTDPLSPPVRHIVQRCLAKDPDQRYQGAGELRAALETAQPTSWDAGPPQPSVQRAGGWKRLPLRVVAVVGIVAVTVAVALWLVANRLAPTQAPLAADFNQLTNSPGIEWFSSLSPDGQWIVFAGDGAGNRDIYLQSVTGQTAINLTADSADDDDQPAFSPDGEQIAFRSGRDGGGIFVMGRTGEAVRRVTREGFNPAWSRDGTRLAYATGRMELRPANSEGRSELWVVSATGGEPTRVYEGDATLPPWSPQGLRIAFGQRLGADRQSNVVTVPAGGGEPVAVTAESAISWNPVWAPDGRHLYFVSNRGGSTNVWRVPIDEVSGQPLGEPEPLTTPAPFAAHLTLSADGQRLAYSAVLETQNIYKLALDPATGEALGDPVPVTTGSRFWSSPDPSPDGQWAVFYSQVQPEGDLYVIRADGTGLRQLTSDEAVDRVPRWSPDGDWILSFSDRSGELRLWKVRVDGSELQQMTSGAEENGVAVFARRSQRGLHDGG